MPPEEQAEMVARRPPQEAMKVDILPRPRRAVSEGLLHLRDPGEPVQVGYQKQWADAAETPADWRDRRGMGGTQEHVPPAD